MTRPVVHKPAAGRREAGWTALLADALCCWLIALGVLVAMRQLFRFDNPLGSILFRSLVTMAGIALLTRRWWIPLASAGGLVALTALSGGLFAAWDYFYGLFVWWLERFPPFSPYHTPGNIELVQWLITLGVCALLFLLVRRLPLVSLLLALGAALITVIYLNGFRENRLALFFIAAGICPLLARGTYTRLSRRADGMAGSRGRTVLAGLAVCAAGALLATLLVPADTMHWKSPALSERLLDAQRLLRGDSLSPFDSLFSLQSSGLQPDQSRLGGDLHWDHTPVLSVKTDAPTLLRGMVYSEYTGSGWEAGAAEDYVLRPPLVETVSESSDQKAFNEIFGQLLPRNRLGGNPLADAMPSASAEITLLCGGYSLYVPERLSWLSPVSQVDTPFLFNGRSEAFSRARLSENTVYEMGFIRFDRTTPDLADRIATIEELSAETASALYDVYYDRTAAAHLQLPAGLPASVSAKAWEVAGGETSPYRQMERLEEYLSSTYRYTTTPGSVPRNRDFVEYFLETGQGYCTYFASAMAVMARTLGVPSRFVVGYGLEASGGNWMAYGDTAHAWVECYIRGVGWVAFDPTAGSDYLDPRASGPAGPGNSTSTTLPPGSSTAPAPTTTTTVPGTSPAPSDGTSASGPQGGEPGWGGLGAAGWILAAAAVVLLLAALLALRVLRRRHAFDLAVLRARLPAPAACADAYYRDLLRQLRLLGLEPETGETIRQFGERAARELPAAGSRRRGRKTGKEAPLPEETARALDGALATVMDWRYGRREPTEDELVRLEAVHQEMEGLVRRRLGALRYFLRRRLF